MGWLRDKGSHEFSDWIKYVRVLATEVTSNKFSFLDLNLLFIFSLHLNIHLATLERLLEAVKLSSGPINR